MKYNPAIHHRSSIRLKGYDYSQAGLYFITICTQNRECLFGKIIDGKMILNEYGKTVETEWLILKNKYPNIELHEYVVMPNHFHGIIELTDMVGAGFARPVNADAHTVRAGFARPVNNHDDNGAGDNNDNGAGEPRPYVPTLGNMVAYFKYQTTKQMNLPAKLWQRNYYEIIIRNDQSYQNIYDYIMNNPLKWSEDKLYHE